MNRLDCLTNKLVLLIIAWEQLGKLKNSMRNLTLIRHGITAWNAQGYFQGHSDIPLSLKGKAQAEALGLHFRRSESFDFDLIYSSTLARATQTAGIALPKANIIYDDNLKELNFGVFEGHTLEENQQHEDWEYWCSDTFKHCAPQGESYEMLRKRVVTWLNTIPEGDVNIAAFTHSGTIQMLISYLLGVEHPKWRKRIFLQHTSLSRILFQDNQVVIEYINDVSHLKIDVFKPKLAQANLESVVR